MGYFSWHCSKTKCSIPHDYRNEVVLVLPNNETIKGHYDGYGSIDGEDIFTAVARAAGIADTREEVFDRYAVNVETKEKVKFFNWEEEPLPNFDGLNANTAREKFPDKFKLESNYDKVMRRVKLVLAYAYEGETYKELRKSKSCEHQGYFYPRTYKKFPKDYVRI